MITFGSRIISNNNSPIYEAPAADLRLTATLSSLEDMDCAGYMAVENRRRYGGRTRLEKLENTSRIP